MRKVSDVGDARACLKAAKGAGLTPTQWAREHGVDARSLNAWRVNLTRARDAKRQSGSTRTPTLVELVPMTTSSPIAAAAHYVVRVADVELVLGDDFREETLVRLVRSLRTC
ncbi:MAG: hypothetical protein IT379_08985 [Deltaproteobacteria bacterium]|nr:hypothetical protein [Deltaproteobacteria bacterium]